jgi:hypothetical protein
MTAGQSFNKSAAMLKKQCNSLPILKQMDKNRKMMYPFLENPNKRDDTIFTILMVTNPFATAKMQ